MGCFHVAPAGRALIFTELGVLGVVRPLPHAGADRLFESVASFTARPANALLDDHVQHAVVLDRPGGRLRERVGAPHASGAVVHRGL